MNILIQIIPAQYTDFDKLLVIWKKTGLNLSDDDSEKRVFSEMLHLNPQSCLVVKLKNQIIGSVFGIFNGRRGWIYHVAVDPKYQKQEIGLKLLHVTEKALLKNKACKVRLWVNFNNLKVIPFYEKNGYQVISDAIMLGKDMEKGGEK